MKKNINFSQIASAALTNIEALLTQWLADGRRSGREWLARNPTRMDGQPGSFSVNMTTGAWADFACDENARGGDLISLRAYLTGSTQLVAAEDIAAQLGIVSIPGNSCSGLKTQFQSKTRRGTDKTDKRVSLPDGSPIAPSSIKHPRLGEPKATWEYQDTFGLPLGYACRFESKGKRKQVLPYSWTDENWQWRAMPEPRPLFKLPALLVKPQMAVLIVEGEKSACAASWMFEKEFLVTTWAGGSAAWRKTDWAPLAGRTCILWPDADKAGKKAMSDIREHLVWKIGGGGKVIELPHNLPQGWDCADLINEEPELRRSFAGVLIKEAASAPRDLCPICWHAGIPAHPSNCPHAKANSLPNLTGA